MSALLKNITSRASRHEREFGKNRVLSCGERARCKANFDGGAAFKPTGSHDDYGHFSVFAACRWFYFESPLYYTGARFDCRAARGFIPSIRARMDSKLYSPEQILGIFLRISAVRVKVVAPFQRFSVL